MSDSLRPHVLQPTRLLRPWDFPRKSTGVGCNCLLRKSHIHTHIYTQRQQISLCCCQKLRKAVLTQYAQGVKITPFLFLESHAYKRKKKKSQHKVNFPLTQSTSIIYQKLLVVLPSKGRNGLLRFIKCQKYIGQ